jgi:hypothetical protein
MVATQPERLIYIADPQREAGGCHLSRTTNPGCHAESTPHRAHVISVSRPRDAARTRVAASAMARPLSSPSGRRHFIPTALLGTLVLVFVPALGSPAARLGAGSWLEVLLANPTDKGGEKNEADEGCRRSAAGDLW